MKKNIGNMTLGELLSELRKVSEAHSARHKGASPIEDQICHTHGEVSELYDAVKQSETLDHSFWTMKQHILEEVWDIVFSAITNAHILRLDDSELLFGLGETLRKIKRREGL